MPLRHIFGAAGPEPQQWYVIKLVWEHRCLTLLSFTDCLPCTKSYLGTWHKMTEKHFLPSRISVLGWADIGLKVNFSWFSSVSLSGPTLWDPMDCSMPGSLVHHQLPELTQTRVPWVGDAIQPSHPLSSCLLLPPSIFPSIRVFSNESVLRIRWSKDWSFSFSISPSNEYSGLISFRIDWFHLLVVQGSLKSLLQYRSSKASVLQCSVFFMIQLTSIHDYWKSHSFD